MEELYHFSEEPDIERFRPRPAAAYPELEPVVFAIDGEHATHYYFPRECPRVIYWKSGRTRRRSTAGFSIIRFRNAQPLPAAHLPEA